jgi:hypothetical protein
VWHTPTGALLTQALPTVGVQGTVQGIGVHTPAQRLRKGSETPETSA